MSSSSSSSSSTTTTTTSVIATLEVRFRTMRQTITWSTIGNGRRLINGLLRNELEHSILPAAQKKTSSPALFFRRNNSNNNDVVLVLESVESSVSDFCDTTNKKTDNTDAHNNNNNNNNTAQKQLFCIVLDNNITISSSSSFLLEEEALLLPYIVADAVRSFVENDYPDKSILGSVMDLAYLGPPLATTELGWHLYGTSDTIMGTDEIELFESSIVRNTIMIREKAADAPKQQQQQEPGGRYDVAVEDDGREHHPSPSAIMVDAITVDNQKLIGNNASGGLPGILEKEEDQNGLVLEVHTTLFRRTIAKNNSSNGATTEESHEENIVLSTGDGLLRMLREPDGDSNNSFFSTVYAIDVFLLRDRYPRPNTNTTTPFSSDPAAALPSLPSLPPHSKDDNHTTPGHYYYHHHRGAFVRGLAKASIALPLFLLAVGGLVVLWCFQKKKKKNRSPKDDDDEEIIVPRPQTNGKSDESSSSFRDCDGASS